METPHITSYKTLKEEIRSLKAERKEQEALLSKQLAEITTVVKDPTPVLRKVIHKMANDPEIRGDLLKTGIHYAGDFLVDTLIQKKGPLLIAGLLEKIEEKTKDTSIGKIVHTISKLFKTNSGEKENQKKED